MQGTNIPLKRSGYSTFTLAYNVKSREEENAVLQETPGAGGQIIKNKEEGVFLPLTATYRR